MAVIEENITFVGDSGKGYKFTAYTKDTSFYDVGAVYIFTRRVWEDGKYKYRFLYVGETEELGTRIRYHEKWDCVNGYDCDSICVHGEENSSERLKKERDLINWGNSPPPCNG